MIVQEISTNFDKQALKMKESFNTFISLTSYEDKMIEVKKHIRSTYKRLHDELDKSENEFSIAMQNFIENKQLTENQKKINGDRTKEYHHVVSQIDKMKNEMQEMIENSDFARIYNEQDVFKKLIDAISVVDLDLQNHLFSNSPPISDLITDLNGLVDSIKHSTAISKLKLCHYKSIGVPTFFKYSPFSLYFKKFKKRVIENDPNLSLLDAALFCYNNWCELDTINRQKYMAAAALINQKEARRAEKVMSYIDPEIKEIREKFEREKRTKKKWSVNGSQGALKRLWLAIMKK